MSKKEWDAFIEDCQDCTDYDLDYLKSDGIMPPSAMPVRKPCETPKFYND